MTSLTKRKTRLTFETSDTIRTYGTIRPKGPDGKPGKPRRVVVHRKIIIQAHERHAVVWLKGTRKRFTYTWEGLYHQSARAEAEKLRRDKAAAKKGKR